MRFPPRRYGLLILSVLLHLRGDLVCPVYARVTWGGFIAAEGRLFTQSALLSEQRGSGAALVAQPEISYAWANARDRITFVPFARLDQHDSRRTHGDIRELSWLHTGAQWRLRLGISRVFWGVTESQHLIDIINQTDLVENIDGEDKLGQPMLNLTWLRSWGTLDVFLLPGFRERTFPGTRGRLRTIPRVAPDQARFTSSLGRAHVDAAVRWSQRFGDWDVGLAHFYGTSREPLLLPGMDRAGQPVLIPQYDVIQQTSLDVQWTIGNWLWKLEAITRSGQGDRFAALTAGFEYTFGNVFHTGAHLGVLAEYLYDSRGRAMPPFFADHIFVGLRLALNDAQSTEALVGSIVNRVSGATLCSLEASRRVGEHWKLSLEVRVLTPIPASDPLASIRQDDYVQLVLARYF